MGGTDWYGFILLNVKFTKRYSKAPFGGWEVKGNVSVLSFPDPSIKCLRGNFFFLIEAYLIYNAVLVSGVQQSDSDIYTHMYTFNIFQL